MSLGDEEAWIGLCSDFPLDDGDEDFMQNPLGSDNASYSFSVKGATCRNGERKWKHGDSGASKHRLGRGDVVGLSLDASKGGDRGVVRISVNGKRLVRDKAAFTDLWVRRRGSHFAINGGSRMYPISTFISAVKKASKNHLSTHAGISGIVRIL